MSIARIVNEILNLYFWIIVVRIFLTWVPSINWSQPPFNIMAAASDLVLEPFRKIIPAIGGIDFSPIIALFVFQFIQYAIVRMLLIFGL